MTTNTTTVEIDRYGIISDAYTLADLITEGIDRFHGRTLFQYRSDAEHQLRMWDEAENPRVVEITITADAGIPVR